MCELGNHMFVQSLGEWVQCENGKVNIDVNSSDQSLETMSVVFAVRKVNKFVHRTPQLTYQNCPRRSRHSFSPKEMPLSEA